MTEGTAKVNLYGATEEYMMEDGKQENNMATEYL